jgi:hypothetical protein
VRRGQPRQARSARAAIGIISPIMRASRARETRRAPISRGSLGLGQPSAMPTASASMGSPKMVENPGKLGPGVRLGAASRNIAMP